MPVLIDQVVPQNTDRSYHVHVPANPPQDPVPAIIVLHGGGQDAATIARRWGLVPGNPVPASVEDYLLVFPEAHPGLNGSWVHHKHSDKAFPTLDLEFVDLLIQEITTARYETGSALIPKVSADPERLYVAGFSSGARMVWQILNSGLATRFQGFAAVGEALHPEVSRRYRRELEESELELPSAPVFYVHGTGEFTFRVPATLQEVPLDTSYPAFTVREMLDRNGIPANAPAAAAFLAPGSANLTEVLVQLFLGNAAFASATVVNGGHNWPEPTTVGNPPVASHFDATEAILDFWHTHAALP